MSSALKNRETHDDQLVIAAVDLFCGAGGLTHGLEKVGVRVSLGTDVSGGASPSMLEALREAVRAVESLTSGPLTSGVT